MDMALNDDKHLDILVMHAEPLVAVGLAAALRQQVGFAVHINGVDDVDAAGIDVDIIVTDYQGGLNLATSRQNRSASLRSAKVLVMTTNDREHDVRLALEAGVHGYLLLGCAIDELASSVRTLGMGSRYMCMAVAQRMADSLAREALTAREAEVLRLLMQGHCNKLIGRQLEIAVGTVKAHVKAIMSKLGASSRTQAASIAAQRGLTDEPMPGLETRQRPVDDSRPGPSAVHERAQYA
jgi:DNA-binding NarL/FixJ family response regulator